MLSKTQLAALLGRSLTASEDTNYETYIDIAQLRLEEMLGYSLANETADRTFDFHPGYRMVYIDPCTAITSVTIDGNAFTTYVKKQNDLYNGSWFNLLEFDDPLYGTNDRLVVSADWGFGKDSNGNAIVPSDLAKLMAGLFAAKDAEAHVVQEKQINRSDRVAYKANDAPLDNLVAQHAATIAKYQRSTAVYVV